METRRRIWTPDRPKLEVPLPILMRATLRHWDKDGRLLWQARDLENILHDTGAEYLLSACFATAFANFGAPPANVYLGLDNRTTPGQTDTLASLSGENALGSYGYSRLALITGGTGAGGQDFVLAKATYWAATSKTVEWTCATQAWTAVKQLFLATDPTAVADASGKHLICTVALQGTRTLLVGDKLDASIILTPSGG